MTLRLDYSGEGANRRVLSDDSNPRIYVEEWRCSDCGVWVPSDEVVWAGPDGILDTDRGDPWCVSCVPTEP